MAKPTTFKFGEFLVEVGDGNSPEIFGAPCGLTSKSFAGAAATNDTNVPDCNDPDAPSWLERDVVSLSRNITGSGVLANEFLETWDDWFHSAVTKNVRITLNDFQWTGAYLLSAFDITGNIGSRVTVSVTLTSDGEIVRALVSN
jgi:hypothetical protein